MLFLNDQESVKAHNLKLPGDFIRHGELIEESLKRSVFEQTNLCIEPIEILGIYSNIDNQSRIHIIESVFVCIITNYYEIRMSKNPTRYTWLNREQIEDKKDVIKGIKIIQDYYSWRNLKSTYWTTKI